MIRLANILYPTDFSELSLQALTYARSFAEAYRGRLHCIHVVDEAYQYWASVGPDGMAIGPPMGDLVKKATEDLKAFVADHIPVGEAEVPREVRVGRPFVEIISYARTHEIDLIVIATHGRSGLKHVLLGSTAERVIRKAPCPVLTVRHPQHDFVMP